MRERSRKFWADHAEYWGIHERYWERRGDKQRAYTCREWRKTAEKYLKMDHGEASEGGRSDRKNPPS